MIISEKKCTQDKSKRQNIIDVISYIAKIGEHVAMADAVDYINIINCRNGFETYESIDALLMEIVIQAEIATKSDNPTVHLVLSWSEDEVPTNKEIDEAVKITLEELTYIDCQAIYGVHKNTQHRHCHLFINRVDLLTDKVCSDSFSHDKLNRAMARIDAVQNWQSPPNAIYRYDEENDEIIKLRNPSPDQNLSSKALASEVYSGYQSAERVVKKYVENILNCKTWEEAQKLMAEKGISVVEKGKGFVFWLAFENQPAIAIKPSKISRYLAHDKLINKWGNFIKYDFTVKPHQMISLNNNDETFYKNIAYNMDRLVQSEYNDELDRIKLYPLSQPTFTAMKQVIEEEKDKKKRKNKDNLEIALAKKIKADSIQYAYEEHENLSYDEPKIYDFNQFIIKDTGNKLFIFYLENDLQFSAIENTFDILSSKNVRFEDCIFQGSQAFKEAVIRKLDKESEESALLHGEKV